MEFRIIKVNQGLLQCGCVSEALIEEELNFSDHEITLKLEKVEILEGTVKEHRALQLLSTLVA